MNEFTNFVNHSNKPAQEGKQMWMGGKKGKEVKERQEERVLAYKRE